MYWASHRKNAGYGRPAASLFFLEQCGSVRPSNGNELVRIAAMRQRVVCKHHATRICEWGNTPLTRCSECHRLTDNILIYTPTVTDILVTLFWRTTDWSLLTQAHSNLMDQGRSFRDKRHKQYRHVLENHRWKQSTSSFLLFSIIVKYRIINLIISSRV